MIKNQIRRFLAALFLLLMSVPSFAQAPERKDETFLQLIIHGNIFIILIWCTILATSITMVTLIIQLAILLQKKKLAPPPLVDSLRQLIGSGNYQEAWETCNANKNYLANVLKAGIGRIGRGKEAVEAGLAEHGMREATLLRTRNSYLSVIGVVSPMIGLLGTVIGMMGAFQVLGASGMKNPNELAGKISEVLLATASGLFIAIPAFVAYYVFRNMSQASIVYSDDIVNTLVSDIPYEELAGVHVGENFATGGMQQPMGMPGGASSQPVAGGAR